ncbi:MAG: NAD-dependent malic enzyme [Chlamydiia bacterium]|nr:NAD-dependent malic enzyme [Chlamydiia bacterium]
MDVFEEALEYHERWKGKLGLQLKAPLDTGEQLALAYTPGVARPCVEIAKDGQAAYRYTAKGNWVAVVTDGSSVLGLGNIGPLAALPVMEGKAALFKRFADVDAFPICLDTQDVDEIVETIVRLAPSFGGINLEDIAAPRCFEIERRLDERLDIPVFHDDQHGTAIVVLAALINALELLKRDKKSIKVVISGAGAAGMAIAKILIDFGVGDVILLDSRGAIFQGREEGMNHYKVEMAEVTNRELIQGGLQEVIVGADVFVGVSQPGILTKEMVETMASKPIVFALSNPIPEIMPDEALAAGAAIVCTGRSDFPNQVNNVLVFPGLFRGVLDARIPSITQEMKLAAAKALAHVIDGEKSTEKVIPNLFDPRVAAAVAEAVKQ